MEGRLGSALEGVMFGMVFAVLAWFLAKGIGKVTGRKIDGGAYYTVAIVAGFLAHRGLITVLTQSG